MLVRTIHPLNTACTLTYLSMLIVWKFPVLLLIVRQNHPCNFGSSSFHRSINLQKGVISPRMFFIKSNDSHSRRTVASVLQFFSSHRCGTQCRINQTDGGASPSLRKKREESARRFCAHASTQMWHRVSLSRLYATPAKDLLSPLLPIPQLSDRAPFLQ